MTTIEPKKPIVLRSAGGPTPPGGGPNPADVDPLGLGGGGSEPPITTINPKLDVYLKKGLTEEVLGQFFDLETGELKPEYSSVKELGPGKDHVLSDEKYKNRFIFQDAKDEGRSIEVTVMEDGTIKIKEMTMGAIDASKLDLKVDPNKTISNARIYSADDLKKRGISDEVRDKYYETVNQVDIVNGEIVKVGESYRLKEGYVLEVTEGGKDPVSGKEYSKRFDFSEVDEKGNKKFGTTISEYVYTDGTAGTRRNGGPTKEENEIEMKKQYNELLSKGYTPEMIDKYFVITARADTGASGYSLDHKYSGVTTSGPGVLLNGEKYKNIFTFKDAKTGDITRVTVMEDGTTETVELGHETLSKVDNVRLQTPVEKFAEWLNGLLSKLIPPTK